MVTRKERTGSKAARAMGESSAGGRQLGAARGVEGGGARHGGCGWCGGQAARGSE